MGRKYLISAIAAVGGRTTCALVMYHDAKPDGRLQRQADLPSTLDSNPCVNSHLTVRAQRLGPRQGRLREE